MLLLESSSSRALCSSATCALLGSAVGDSSECTTCPLHSLPVWIADRVGVVFEPVPRSVVARAAGTRDVRLPLTRSLSAGDKKAMPAVRSKNRRMTEPVARGGPHGWQMYVCGSSSSSAVFEAASQLTTRTGNPFHADEFFALRHQFRLLSRPSCNNPSITKDLSADRRDQPIGNSGLRAVPVVNKRVDKLRGRLPTL